MRLAAFGALAVLSLSACAPMQADRMASPAILAALDSQGDGYVGSTATGERFTIVSTSASATELCRVVSIESAGTFDVESFCKARGGQWR